MQVHIGALEIDQHQQAGLGQLDAEALYVVFRPASRWERGHLARVESATPSILQGWWPLRRTLRNVSE